MIDVTRLRRRAGLCRHPFSCRLAAWLRGRPRVYSPLSWSRGSRLRWWGIVVRRRRRSSVAWSTRRSGNCSPTLVSDKLPWSWRSFGEYLDWLDGRGVPINCAFLVGHGMVRCGVMRDPTSLASRRELRRDAAARGKLHRRRRLWHVGGARVLSRPVTPLLRRSPR